MAGFEGVVWAPNQMQYGIHSKQFRILNAHATTFAISRSLHYGLFQVFEGIRFYCTRGEEGLELRFLNLHLNLARFRKEILDPPKDKDFVPTESNYARDISQSFALQTFVHFRTHGGSRSARVLFAPLRSMRKNHWCDLPKRA